MVDWVGTSMGGIIGMLMAATENAPIRRLVLNDVGPFIPLTALKRIADYAGMAVEFTDEAQLERHMRANYASFGITRDEDWKHLVRAWRAALPNGKLAFAYDPAIAQNFKTLKEDVDFWDVYDRIRCPTLLIARCKIGCAFGRGGAGNDGARTQSAADRISRRRPCAGL